MKIKVNRVEWLKCVAIHIWRVCIDIFSPIYGLKIWFDLHDRFYWVRFHILFIAIDIPLKPIDFYWNACCECGEKINPQENTYANRHNNCLIQDI